MKIFKKWMAGAASAALVFSTYLPVFASKLYDDVDGTESWYAGIKYCTEHGIMTGYSDRIFAPDNTLTRGEMITIIHRMVGKPAAAGSGFSDVPYSSFYKEASTWAMQSGIMTGNLHADGTWTFDGQSPLTEAQACVILYRYAKTLGSGAADGNHLPRWLS